MYQGSYVLYYSHNKGCPRPLELVFFCVVILDQKKLQTME